MNKGVIKVRVGDSDPFEIEWECSPGALPLGTTATYPIEYPGAIKPRPGQFETAKLALDLVDRGTVYIDAPTGSGKTIIAKLMCETTLRSSLVLTADHALQTQYEEEGFTSLTGRSNWPCPRAPGKHAGNAPCTTGAITMRECEFVQKGLCPYFLAKNEFMKEPLRVTNYDWYLTGGRFSFPKAPLVIADEAHKAEEIIRSNQTVRVKGLWPGTGGGNTAIAMRSHLADLILARKSIEDSVSAARDEAEEEFYRISIQSVDMEISALHKALKAFETPDKYLITKTPSYLEVIPLVGDPKLLGEHRVMMSATPTHPSLTETGRWYYLKLPAHFPAEHRPVVPLNVANIKNGASEEEYDKLVSSIDMLMVKHSHWKGVIHVPSYELANKIVQKSQYASMMITHGPGDRDKALASFKNAPAGRVLVSPACMQGVDLPYDECRWQAIAKLPFPNIGDPLEKARREKLPDLSAAGTARLIVQASGRGVRFDDDTCVTYILDSNWGWFFQKHSQHFPAWFKSAITSYPTLDKIFRLWHDGSMKKTQEETRD